jgi:hypothetical protein
MKNTIFVLIMAMLLMVSAVSVSAVPVIDMETSCQSSYSNVGVWGFVEDANQAGIANLPIDVFCRNSQNQTFQISAVSPQLVTSNIGGLEGYYYAGYSNVGKTLNTTCKKGDYATAKVVIGNVTYTSNETLITCTSNFYNEGGNTNISVPEFTTITLGVAIAGAMLGLVFLRKNN